MDSRLFAKALTRFFAGLIIVAALIFLPAGTFSYPQGWLLIGILFAPMFIAGLIMMKKNPRLLEKRLNAKEKESEQRAVILFSGMMFLAAFILAGNTIVLSTLAGTLGINRFAAKLITEVIFFAISWTVQKYVIFFREDSDDTGTERIQKLGTQERQI